MHVHYQAEIEASDGDRVQIEASDGGGVWIQVPGDDGPGWVVLTRDQTLDLCCALLGAIEVL